MDGIIAETDAHMMQRTQVTNKSRTEWTKAVGNIMLRMDGVYDKNELEETIFEVSPKSIGHSTCS